jgi:hypothetical protein
VILVLIKKLLLSFPPFRRGKYVPFAVVLLSLSLSLSGRLVLARRWFLLAVAAGLSLHGRFVFLSGGGSSAPGS